jgi:hypothetical protein
VRDEIRLGLPRHGKRKFTMILSGLERDEVLICDRSYWTPGTTRESSYNVQAADSGVCHLMQWK